MKGYLSVLKSSMMIKLSRKSSLIFSFIANSLFITIIFYLWNAIYNEGVIGATSVTCDDTIIRLAMATSISSTLLTNIEWYISFDILSGNIITSLIKPLKLYSLKLLEAMGISICNFITITLPMIIILFVFYIDHLRVGINIVFFLISIIISMILVFNIDYMVALTSFYTESIWGISMTKNIIISLLAGAVVPISFFPDILRNVSNNSPFYVIYQIPINILTSANYDIQKYFSGICLQLFWCLLMVVIGQWISNKAMRNITINGG